MFGPESVGRAIAWTVHCSRVAFLVLAALACALLLVRLLLLRVLARRLSPPLQHPARITLLCALAFLGLVVAGFLALKPDEAFLLREGTQAVRTGQYTRAIQFYEPLAHWGTHRPEVYENLGLGYLQSRRYASAVTALHRALVLAAPTVEAHMLCAEAHWHLGDPVMAVGHLAQALPLARSLEEGDRIAASMRAISLNVRLGARATEAAPTPGPAWAFPRSSVPLAEGRVDQRSPRDAPR